MEVNDNYYYWNYNDNYYVDYMDSVGYKRVLRNVVNDFYIKK